jgi:hypothetical protein
MLHPPTSQVSHVSCKWIPILIATSTASIPSTSPTLLGLGIAPTLVVAAFCIPILGGDCHAVDRWDVEGRCCDSLGGTDVHCRYVLHDGRLIGCQLVDCSHHVGCNRGCCGGCKCASSLKSCWHHCCCHHRHREGDVIADVFLAVNVQNVVDILVDVSLLPRCIPQLHGHEAP